MKLCKNSHHIEVGVDEAGAGCLAGPVFAAAVIWNPELCPDNKLNDSKQVSPKERERLYDYIRENAIDYNIVSIDNQRVDTVNIRNARIEAMHLAIDGLNVIPDEILVDGNAFKPYKQISHDLVIKGDSKYVSIAAASILAKVARDRMVVRELHREYPMYGWDKNKGYATRSHYDALHKYGPTKYHRHSFRLH